MSSEESQAPKGGVVVVAMMPTNPTSSEDVPSTTRSPVASTDAYSSSLVPEIKISSSNDVDASKDDDQLRQLRQQVWEFCASIPVEERREYTQAQQQSLHVFRTESDPLKFLRCENGNVEQAGLRLIRYWKNRCDRFGTDRFALPMNLTGQGALDEKDIAAVKVGFLSFLPDDSQGRTVLYFDHALATRKLDGIDARYPRIRTEFYMLHLAEMLNKPLVMIRYSESFQIDKAKMQAFQEYWDFAPFRLDSVYLTYLPPPGAKRIFKQTVAPLVTQHLHKLLQTVRDHKTFVGSTRAELFDNLTQLGFDPTRLPLEVGGSYNTLEFHPGWFQKQASHEEGLWKDDSGQEEDLDVKPKAVSPPPVEQDSSVQEEVQSLPATKVTEEVAAAEVVETAQEEAVVPKPTTSLPCVPQVISREQTAEILVPSSSCSAKDDVAMPSTSELDDDRLQLLQDRRNRKRKKDLAYSRERRQREKDQIDTLQAEVKQLSKTNDALRHEEAKLAILLVDAQNKIGAAGVAPSLPLYGGLASTTTRNSFPQSSVSSSPFQPRDASVSKEVLEARLLELMAAADRRQGHLSSTMPRERDPLLVELERMEEQQQQRRMLLREQAQRLSSLEGVSYGGGPSSVELAQLLRLQQQQQQVQQQQGLLGLMARPPTDSPRRELALESLLERERQKSALLEELALTGLARSASLTRTLHDRNVDPRLLLGLLEDAAVPASPARASLLPPLSRQPSSTESQLRLLQLLQSAQAPRQVEPVSALSDEDVLLLQMLNRRR